MREAESPTVPSPMTCEHAANGGSPVTEPALVNSDRRGARKIFPSTIEMFATLPIWNNRVRTAQRPDEWSGALPTIAQEKSLAAPRKAWTTWTLLPAGFLRDVGVSVGSWS